MFRIKVCGITTVDDARQAAHAGADAIGFNFYPRSKRYVSIDAAAELDASLPEPVTRVGLFVNSPVREIREHLARVRIDLVQMHGDEPPELLAELRDLPVMRAFRCRETLEPIDAYLARCRRLDCLPQAILLDAWHATAYGGTGTLADWSLAQSYQREGSPPLVLAGGLDADNVAEAIRTVRPAAVDVASGVESTPGRKDARRLAAFVSRARHEFERLDAAT